VAHFILSSASNAEDDVKSDLDKQFRMKQCVRTIGLRATFAAHCVHQERYPCGDHADRESQHATGHVVVQIRVEGDHSAPDRECDGERCFDQACLSGEPEITGGFLVRVEPTRQEQEPDQKRSRAAAPFQILEATACSALRQNKNFCCCDCPFCAVHFAV